MTGNKITAAGEKVTLVVPKDMYEVQDLQEALDAIAESPVQVENGSVTVDASDLDAVKEILATIGLEVYEEKIQAAEEEVVVDPENQEEILPEESVYNGVEEQVNLEGTYNLISAMSGAQRPSWILMAGANPVARINLDDQVQASKIAGYFGKDEYRSTVIEAFKKHGIAATLEKLKAEVLTAKAVKPAEPVDTQAIQASAIDRYRTCFSLALQAAAKNMIDNHLKAAMFAALSGQVEDPSAVVEEVFDNSDEFMDEVDAKAMEYMAMDDSGLKATQTLIASMDTRIPQAGASLRAKRKDLSAGNLHIDTQIVASDENAGADLTARRQRNSLALSKI